ncbi:hypothetical protein N9U76_01945 [Prochlorococcus sp. AH-736-L19]|nr:hypothetical protein [Prochlorococcus sp. AH-736-L19]MDA9704180.1 hypothetical protein [Prochlorococcus sp. AH-736-L19]
MKNQNITFQQFIEKLKTIDVGELLEKAKSIKVEDIKSMKFSDLKEITNSKYFYPSIGIIFASLSSILFLFPSFETLKIRQAKSSQYKNEYQELPLINQELEKRLLSQKNFEKLYSEFIALVPEKKDLVLLPEILFDSAKRSKTEIIELSPITKDDLSSCSTQSEEDLFNTEFGINNNFEDSIDNDFNDLEEPPIDDFYMDNNSIQDDSKLEVYEFNLNEDEGTKDFINVQKNISDIFESNYFLINIKSDYLNSLKFLKYIQEYKMVILPYCFEPRVKGELTNSMSEINNNEIAGEIDARIIVNIPYYKEK